MNNTENQSHRSISVENRNESLLKRRRDFIKKTSVAVPVVLTLRSGSVFAAESATCAVKLKGIATPPPTVTNSEDKTWLRFKTECVSVVKVLKPATTTTDPNTNQVTTVPAELDDPNNAKQVYFAPLASSSGHGWFEYNQDNSGTPLLTVDDMNNKDKWSQLSSPSACYVLKQYDDQGKDTGIVGPSGTSGGIPLTVSCYDSLSP